MENSLHFGIDKLSKQYEKIVALKFPQIPEDDILYDLYSELVELDGYVMGIITTFIKEGEKNDLLCYDSEFNEILSNIHKESDELESLISYKKELDNLTYIFNNTDL